MLCSKVVGLKPAARERSGADRQPTASLTVAEADEAQLRIAVQRSAKRDKMLQVEQAC